MIGNKKSFKYENPFKGLYEIFQTWKNGTVNLQTGFFTIRVNISALSLIRKISKKQTPSYVEEDKHTYITNIYTCSQ